jgi:hypothetical protein
MPRLSITHLGVASQDAGGLSRDGILGQASAETLAYIAAVEAADGAQLEPAVLAAIVPFANWRIPLGGACCILAGARTLAGALVPLVGPAPTGVNLVAGDYNRQRIMPDGSTKSIAFNYDNDTPAQNSRHIFCWAHASYTPIGAFRFIVGTQSVASGHSGVGYDSANRIRAISSGAGLMALVTTNPLPAGGLGAFRSGADDGAHVIGSVVTPVAGNPSAAPAAAGYSLWGAGSNGAAVPASLYSAGAYIDPAELTSRTAALVSALAAALP